MDLEELNRWLAERNMTGFWNAERGGEEVKPCLWKWDDVYRGLTAAAELVPMDTVAMRTVQLKNPGLRKGMSNTLHFSVQILMPGERTIAHRNLVGETRFVLEAPEGAVFTVDGEPFPMRAGDLITTPNWCWHDHYNGGDEPAIWLDGMDARLVGMGKPINEKYPQPQQPVVRPEGYSALRVGQARPAWIQQEHPTPPMHYRWEDTLTTLQALKASETEGDPFNGLRLTYSHPLNGGPTLPTYACEIQLLTPRHKTQTHRHNSTTVYHAFRGAGVTEVEGERLEWSQGDIFLVPPWTWHHHENRLPEDAVLYSIADWPAMNALGLYKEEAG
jgi:gentisate 1,2-dioxygenase